MRSRFPLRTAAIGLAMILPATSLQGLLAPEGACLERQYDRASAVLEGTVIDRTSHYNASGAIETRVTLQVTAVYKGTISPVISMTLLGGAVGREAHVVGCQPTLAVGDSRLFFLAEDNRGTFTPVAAAASLLTKGSARFDQARSTVQVLALQDTARLLDESTLTSEQVGLIQPVGAFRATSATNILISSLGLGSRFLQPDRGAPIPYLVDADFLPAGISLSSALNALSNALAEWEAISSARFAYQGIQSFGQSANSTNFPADGVLRIQLHDAYGAITGPDTLGIGGPHARSNGEPADWTNGGQVFGNDFYRVTRGFVVLKHTQTAMQTLSTFEEVLCHEVGHALGMAHSTPDEDAPVGSPAYEAQMYYIAHDDGRGAFPTLWDDQVLNQIHPISNTPPYLFDRVMDVVTANPQPAVPGINEIALAGYDLQGTPLSFATNGPAALNGAWTLTPTNLSYQAGGFFHTGPGNPDPTLSAYERLYIRCSDGVHQSPVKEIRVIGYVQDTSPATSDGIPDYWMIDKFGSANGAVATGDNDNDTLDNLKEYRTGMDPNSALSAQRVSVTRDGVVSWQAQPYALYELRGSINLTDWFFVEAVAPTTDTGTASLSSGAGPTLYRVFKVR